MSLTILRFTAQKRTNCQGIQVRHHFVKAVGRVTESQRSSVAGRGREFIGRIWVGFWKAARIPDGLMMSHAHW
jgi:hypothetical protein